MPSARAPRPKRRPLTASHLQRLLVYFDKRIALAQSTRSRSGLHFIRGRLYLRIGACNHAVADFDRVIELTPDCERAYADKANALFTDRRYLESAKVLTKQYQQFGSTKCFLDRGDTFLAARRLRRALTDFLVYVHYHPRCARGLSRTGSVFLYSGGDLALATKFLSRSLALDKRPDSRLMDLGVAFYWQGKLTKALTCLRLYAPFEPAYARDIRIALFPPLIRLVLATRKGLLAESERGFFNKLANQDLNADDVVLEGVKYGLSDNWRAVIHCSLGEYFRETGRIQEARRQYKQAAGKSISYFTFVLFRRMAVRRLRQLKRQE